MFLASRLHLRSTRQLPGIFLAALDTFVHTEPHLGIMGRYHDRLVNPEFITWTTTESSLPQAWSNAKERSAEGKQRLAAQVSP